MKQTNERVGAGRGASSKTRIVGLLVLIGLLICIVFWLRLQQIDQKQMHEAAALPAGGEAIRGEAPVHTNFASRDNAHLRFYADGFNQFIQAAKPFGLDKPIRPEDITFVRTNENGRIVLLETDSHLFEFHGGKLRFLCQSVPVQGKCPFRG